MLELTLSAFAWAGVILFQAIVHFTIRTQKRLNGNDVDLDQPAMEASPLVLDELAAIGNLEDEGGPYAPEVPTVPLGPASGTEAVGGVVFQDEIDPLDGDEPPVFFELLSQTGCEMMRVRGYIECLAPFFSIFSYLIVYFRCAECFNRKHRFRAIERMRPYTATVETVRLGKRVAGTRSVIVAPRSRTARCRVSIIFILLLPSCVMFGTARRQ